MRCGNCNKFVSQDAGEPEINREEVDLGQKTVEVDVTMKLECAECGGELALCELSESIEFPEQLLKHLEENPDHEVELDDWGGVEAGDYYDGDAKTPMRYRRHIYTADYENTLKCSCGEEFPINHTFEERASSFEPTW